MQKCCQGKGEKGSNGIYGLGKTRVVTEMIRKILNTKRVDMLRSLYLWKTIYRL